MTEQQDRPTIRRCNELLEQIGKLLDEQDFAAAHDSVRPEIADAIQAAEEVDLGAIVEMVQKPGGIIRMDRDLTDEEFAELRCRFEEATKDTRLRTLRTVVEPPCTECGTTDPCGLHCLDRTAAELHRAVVLAEVDAAEPAKPRSIVGRIWQRLRSWRR